VQRPPRREEKSAARREAILAAALNEFSARGFAAARLDDVAKRAGVAKGTIYLHFRDKEALFQEIIRSLMGPFVGTVERAFNANVPLRTLADQVVELFVREVFCTRRKDVIRLMMTEGPRFPKLAEFYYREVLSRVFGAARKRLQRALDGGEISHKALVRYPQLIAALYGKGGFALVLGATTACAIVFATCTVAIALLASRVESKNARMQPGE
jgi:AcrR family transcriptional regulator